MKFYHFEEIDIISAIHYIDKLLISLHIKPVLNYKAIEYRLLYQGRALMNIRLQKDRLGIEALYDKEDVLHQEYFNKVSKAILANLPFNPKDKKNE